MPSVTECCKNESLHLVVCLHFSMFGSTVSESQGILKSFQLDSQKRV